MSDQPLVLSLFPGIGLLDMAFELEGFCVVRGPDLLWGGDIHRFHPPAGKFEGVIGGPPCQLYGGFANFAHRWKHPPEHMIPEFERCVRLAQPAWFLMENVEGAPIPNPGCYYVDDVLLNNRWFGEVQSRKRRFSLGSKEMLPRSIRPCILVDPLMRIEFEQTVTASHGGERRTHCKKGATGGAITRYKLPRACELQGLPVDFLARSPLTEQGKLKAVAQGVPLPMGRAVAKAVKQAMGYHLEGVA